MRASANIKQKPKPQDIIVDKLGGCLDTFGRLIENRQSSSQGMDKGDEDFARSLKRDLAVFTAIGRGQVMHSQRLNLPPLNPWVVVEKDGEIITAHCDCAAGLGECCSHVGGVLYAIEDAMRNHSDLSVKDVSVNLTVDSDRVRAPVVNAGSTDSGEDQSHAQLKMKQTPNHNELEEMQMEESIFARRSSITRTPPSTRKNSLSSISSGKSDRNETEQRKRDDITTAILPSQTRRKTEKTDIQLAIEKLINKLEELKNYTKTSVNTKSEIKSGILEASSLAARVNRLNRTKELSDCGTQCETWSTAQQINKSTQTIVPQSDVVEIWTR
ncbi:unnamed protein product [Phaedon cochleariae]|uniref:SWIM-type domain-containing protein n=1 Tax=Phaedon cochleariae TaxID=80249 RepID=A0A9N9SG09_PHACE|nr:unnamed protein product [Phaedon cochleariae]